MRSRAPGLVVDRPRWVIALRVGFSRRSMVAAEILSRAALICGLIARQPQRQDGLEAFGAGQIGRQPDLLEGFADCAAILERLASPLLGFGLGEAFEAAQLPDGVLAVLAARGAVLIEDTALIPGHALVSTMKGFEVFPWLVVLINTSPGEVLSR